MCSLYWAYRLDWFSIFKCSIFVQLERVSGGHTFQHARLWCPRIRLRRPGRPVDERKRTVKNRRDTLHRVDWNWTLSWEHQSVVSDGRRPTDGLTNPVALRQMFPVVLWPWDPGRKIHWSMAPDRVIDGTGLLLTMPAVTSAHDCENDADGGDVSGSVPFFKTR